MERLHLPDAGPDTTMRVSQRRSRIVEMVRQQRRVSVEALSAAFEASPETIRRDLADLARLGLVRKFHGGAALPEPAPPEPREQVKEGSFQVRLTEQVAEKRAIGRTAARLFRPGETLCIDTGSTTLVFGEELAAVPNLTVITNSVVIARAIAGKGNGSRAFLLGGELDAAAGETLGALVLEQLQQFHTGHAVLTVGAMTPQGIFDFSIGETEVARTMIGRARQVTVLADASKLRKTGLFQVAPLHAVHRLVTDRAPEPAMAAALAEAGVEVVVAG